MDARLDAHAPADEEAGSEGAAHTRRAAPIVPASSIAGRTLVAVIGIMTFLASLTIGAVDLVRGAARTWESDVVREVTVQIRPLEGRDLDEAARRVIAAARAIPGVVDVRPYSKEETARLLEPWLGSGLDLDELPIPRLVVLRLAEGGTADLAGLRSRLEREVPGASLDDHRRWVERLRGMAGSLVAIGVGVLSLVMAATVLTVVFATGGTMAGNREIIEVLHLVGAGDGFIAREFQRRFLRLGLMGGAIGGGAALLLFAILGLVASNRLATPMVDQAEALFGRFTLGDASYVGVIAVALAIAALTAATSRITVLRHLARLD